MRSAPRPPPPAWPEAAVWPDAPPRPRRRPPRPAPPSHKELPTAEAPRVLLARIAATSKSRFRPLVKSVVSLLRIPARMLTWLPPIALLNDSAPISKTVYPHPLRNIARHCINSKGAYAIGVRRAGLAQIDQRSIRRPQRAAIGVAPLRVARKAIRVGAHLFPFARKVPLTLEARARALLRANPCSVCPRLAVHWQIAPALGAFETIDTKSQVLARATANRRPLVIRASIPMVSPRRVDPAQARLRDVRTISSVDERHHFGARLWSAGKRACFTRLLSGSNASYGRQAGKPGDASRQARDEYEAQAGTRANARGHSSTCAMDIDRGLTRNWLHAMQCAQLFGTGSRTHHGCARSPQSTAFPRAATRFKFLRVPRLGHTALVIFSALKPETRRARESSGAAYLMVLPLHCVTPCMLTHCGRRSRSRSSWVRRSPERA